MREGNGPENFVVFFGITCFATVSQRKCEVQMNNSSSEKLFHSNWNCLNFDGPSMSPSISLSSSVLTVFM
ncbi:hypothetical protein TNCT_469811 [Trichonephila clavata]|uniref:Uncharacterized protein n=1 Tax=Trichonephila clavata TaxID=2740835 RepID=A0A8X6GUE7_TRICU|nr:hypothetical protein TNCT_469811 [Trichonephila clavata]